MSKFGNFFNGDTLAVPIPESAPKEIPRIILHSADGKFKLEIAESRVNFFRYRKDDDVEIDTSQIRDLSSRVLKEYKDCTHSIIGRLALVVVKSLESENSGFTLARHFCKDKWIAELFSRPDNFEIHSHKNYTLKEFNINSWVRCKTGRLAKNNEPIILVTQDINTLAEELEKRDFSIRQLEAFLEIAYKEQEQTLRKYFPKEE
ncbi:unnamed protein product [marine sediment metagenome]|uniref:Uncharacterized protein n=1 Tax=marine sediment metagenome TaxID=412755 RepID=X1HN61_9ZZZZ